MAATNYSIGIGIAMLGVSYAVCALIPGLLIREKMFDPEAVEAPRWANHDQASLGAVKPAVTLVASERG
jgi:hypothetical protein